MMGRKNKGMCLPYNGLIMKILENVGFNLGEEEAEQDITIIRKTALGKMCFKIVNVEIF